MKKAFSRVRDLPLAGLRERQRARFFDYLRSVDSSNAAPAKALRQAIVDAYKADKTDPAVA